MNSLLDVKEVLLIILGVVMTMYYVRKLTLFLRCITKALWNCSEIIYIILQQREDRQTNRWVDETSMAVEAEEQVYRSSLSSLFCVYLEN